MSDRRRRVLFLTQRLPYAPNRGDRVRSWHILRELARHFDVDVAALVHDEEEASHVTDLRDLTDRVLIGRVPRVRNHLVGLARLSSRLPLTLSLLDSPWLRAALPAFVAQRRPDVVLAFCSSMARFAMEPALQPIPLVIDMVDADSGKWADLAEKSSGLRRWIYRREAFTMAAFEAQVMRAAHATVCVNEREVNLLRAVAPDARVQAVENGISLETFTRPPDWSDRRREVVFCGVMNYEPNVAGALWFAEEIWPRVRAQAPDATLSIVGSSPTAAVARLSSHAMGITVTGAVPEVAPYVWRASVAAAPLLTARGVQNKVLEAVAAGVPCVVTSAVAKGLPVSVRSACPEADTAGEFAAHVLRCLNLDDESRTAMTAVDLQCLSWSTRLKDLPALLSEAAAGARR